MRDSNVDTIQSGEYLHYKGKKYEVFCLSTHSETEERLVVYRPLYGEAYDNNDRFGDVWVRPLTMFLENVNINGKVIPRFKKL